MVFSSVPLYLDPPNWQQHPNQQLQASGVGNENHQHSIQPPPLLPHPPPHVAIGGVPPIRPNSMAERARLAKIAPPETPLKCPRCDSTNTKFCYFNNYNLSQPRHFCKTCRRYWTRGGALRNVPVGGGCRRNKRSSSSKSSSGGSSAGGGSSSTKPSLLTSPTTAVGGGERHVDLMVNTSQLAPTITGIPSGAGGAGSGMSFMASLQNIAQLGMGSLGLTTFGGSLNAPLGGLGDVGTHHHLLSHSQLVPNFLGGGGFEVPGSSATGTGCGDGGGGGGRGLYMSSFNHSDQTTTLVGGCDGGGEDDDDHQNIPKDSSRMMSVKMEEGQGINLAKQLMGINSASSQNAMSNNDFWGGTMGNMAAGANSMWTDLSGLNNSSSSTTHLL